MIFTCAPTCKHPYHQHGKVAKVAAGMFTSLATKKLAKRKDGHQNIDVHCHYFNPVVGKKASVLNPLEKDLLYIYANKLTRATNAKQMRDRAPMLSDVSVRLQDMDRMGIDIQVVSPAPAQYYYLADAAFGAELARDVNEGMAELVAQHPDRLIGLGTVPLQDAGLAVKELKHAVKNLGMKGIEINTHVNGKNLTDPSLKLEKFFATISELGVALFIHPNGFTEASRLENHYFNNVIGNPLDTTIAVSHLIFDGVLERNPKLKVLLPHAGGYLAHYWARMDHVYGARPDGRTVIKRKPSSYLEKFYFDSLTFDPGMLRNMIERFGADHVMLGTDYPYDMAEVDPLGAISAVKGLKKSDRDMITGGNAMKLFKINSK
jgi:aminocarboxymuconate-semialdehyde decarboxylase